MPFTIIKGDITDFKTDAIVNAANEMLYMGGGVCGAIFKKAGAYELTLCLDNLSPVKTGDAVITPGFLLKSKYIIHAVGPRYDKNDIFCEKKLYNAYINSLKIAKENGVKSIAFPLISSGIYGYPVPQALEVALNAFKIFLNKEEMDIYLVIYDEKTFDIDRRYKSSLINYFDQIKMDDDFYQLKESPEKKIEKNLSFNKFLLKLINDKKLKVNDVCVNANMKRDYFLNILDENYYPNKIEIVSFGIALKLKLNELILFLNSFGYSFSRIDKFDNIIEFFIQNEIYDIYEINSVLFNYDAPLLSML